MKRLVTLALFALLVQACMACAEEPLGRLFFTPEQRAQLDAARRSRPRTPYVEPEAEESRPAGSVAYSGMVKRSDGRTTVWINHRPFNENSDPDPVVRHPRLRRDGTTSVNLPEQRARVDLKVGQTADLATGRVLEGYTRPPAVRSLEPTAPPRESDVPLRLRRRFDRERDAPPYDAIP